MGCTAKADKTKLGKNCYDFSRGLRKLKIQIRLSPTGKSKAPKKLPKNRDTGVAASHPDYPASTNVSSPVQAASRRRVRQKSDAQNDRPMHKNGYVKDDFVTSDEGSDALDELNNDSEDGFAPVRGLGGRQRRPKKQLGPPITTDEKIEKLNPIHRMVVEDFLITAKQQSQKVNFPGYHAQVLITKLVTFRF